MEKPAVATVRQKKLLGIGVVLGIMVLGLIAMVIGLVVMNNKSQKPHKSIDKYVASETIPEAAANYISSAQSQYKIPDHASFVSTGNDVKHKVISYTDFGCGHCKHSHALIQKIAKEYKDRGVQFIFRHFALWQPFSGIRDKVSEAAYVVAGDDGYNKMSEQLFKDAGYLRGGSATADLAKVDEAIRTLAGKAGIDADKLLAAYRDSANNGIDEKLSRDNSYAEQSKVQGTPAFFIDGRQYKGAPTDIEDALEELED